LPVASWGVVRTSGDRERSVASGWKLGRRATGRSPSFRWLSKWRKIARHSPSLAETPRGWADLTKNPLGDVLGGVWCSQPTPAGDVGARPGNDDSGAGPRQWRPLLRAACRGLEQAVAQERRSGRGWSPSRRAGPAGAHKLSGLIQKGHTVLGKHRDAAQGASASEAGVDPNPYRSRPQGSPLMPFGYREGIAIRKAVRSTVQQVVYVK